jgi:transcription initiation factor TFIID subunit TAF12
VCRHDPKYILKTYNNMLDSNTALVKEFIRRKMPDKAQFYTTTMIMDAYYTMNREEWLNQDNEEYRDETEKRFKEYYLEFKEYFEAINKGIKNQIIVGIRNRMFQEGMMLESVTFDDWIKHILTL